MIVYAHAAPHTPMRLTPMAVMRCKGVTLLKLLVPGSLLRVVLFPALRVFEMSEEESWVKMDVGRAIRITPKKDMMPAICSTRLNGSWSSIEHIQHVRSGARKVMTVASASGRYIKASIA